MYIYIYVQNVCLWTEGMWWFREQGCRMEGMALRATFFESLSMSPHTLAKLLGEWENPEP